MDLEAFFLPRRLAGAFAAGFSAAGLAAGFAAAVFFAPEALDFAVLAVLLEVWELALAAGFAAGFALAEADLAFDLGAILRPAGLATDLRPELVLAPPELVIFFLGQPSASFCERWSFWLQ